MAPPYPITIFAQSELKLKSLFVGGEKKRRKKKKKNSN
jgi:hypothetical protein